MDETRDNLDEVFDSRLQAPPERQDEFLETNHIQTLGDIVDAHSDSRYDLELTTRGLNTADLKDPDPLADVVGYAGNFSNDGMGGATVDDALASDYGDEETMAGEYGPDDSEMPDDVGQAAVLGDDTGLTIDEQLVLSGGVGDVHIGAALPSGFQIETLSEPGEEPRLVNEQDEPDFAVEDIATGSITPASARGVGDAETNDDHHRGDVTDGT